MPLAPKHSHSRLCAGGPGQGMACAVPRSRRSRAQALTTTDSVSLQRQRGRCRAELTERVGRELERRAVGDVEHHLHGVEPATVERADEMAQVRLAIACIDHRRRWDGTTTPARAAGTKWSPNRAFLATRASYVTGTVIHVNGGLYRG